MHVAVDGRVIQDHFPGIGRYVYHLVDALATVAPEERFTVLHLPGQSDTRFDLAALAEHANVALCAVDAPVFGLAAQWRVPKALGAIRADVFHATYWSGPYRPGIPTVVSIYDLITRHVPGSAPPARRWLLEAMLRLAIRSARHVLTLSEWSKRDLVGAFGLPPERVTAVPLAADTRFRPSGADAIATMRARLGLPDRYVLYVGINKPHKNVATLIDAWGRLVADRPEVAAGMEVAAGAVGTAGAAGTALVVAGRWDARYDGLRARAAALPPGARVVFAGPVSDGDLPALYSGAAAFAFPSRYEGFGLPPLEAMACGTPVIAANATSLPEVVGDAGRLVDPDDVGGWATALAEVLTRPDVAAELRRRGLARAAAFTWAEAARRTVGVYGGAMGRN